MPDREKVIKNIERCNEDGLCIDCEYNQRMACKHFLLRDALALLKQEAVEPKSHPAKAWTRAKTLWFCGACGARISKQRTKFCQECGKPVLWEGR